jgi:hypothetical protein
VAGADKAHGNFAAVGDENFVEEFTHVASMLARSAEVLA